jgi:hypothetical protein
VLIVIAVLLLVFVVLGFIGRASRKRERAQVTVRKGEQDKALAALKSRDPAFDADRFATRARTVMAQVNAAWNQGDMRPARALISDGVFVRFQTQLAMLKRANLRNVMADWESVSAELVWAESDALWDTLDVKMVGRARDAEVAASASAGDAARQASEAPLEEYEEVWSFVRRRGKATPDGKAGIPVMDGKCPGCGATVVMSETVRCTYCKALMNSGEHDWVLAEITQPEEWDPEVYSEYIDGFPELAARDSALSRQALEDRASVIFWKWIAARATGERARLDRFCLRPGQPELLPTMLSDVAVGRCELYSAEVGQDGLDRVRVHVTWSAKVGDGYVNTTHILTLARAQDARSPAGLSSLDCPSCGGALAESDDAKCRWCGEPLAGGKHEWALEAVGKHAESAAA